MARRPLTGLLTVGAAGELRGVTRQAVLNWIKLGLLTPAAVGNSADGRTTYLLRRADVLAVIPRPPGRPKGKSRTNKRA